MKILSHIFWGGENVLLYIHLQVSKAPARHGKAGSMILNKEIGAEEV